MQLYHYTIEAIAAAHQSDAGNARRWECHAYCADQALAWARQWFRCNATVTRVIECKAV